MTYKTEVINDPLGQTHSLASLANIVFALFCFARFLKVGMDVRTDNTCKNNDHSLPAVTVDRPRGSIISYSVWFVSYI